MSEPTPDREPGAKRMLSEGTYYIHSKSDPRWNMSGRGRVGMFDHTVCQPLIEQKKEELGEDPPEDLEVGYMKD